MISIALGINCIARRTLPLSAQSVSLQLGRHPTRPLAFLVTGKPPPLPNHVVNLVLMPASASATETATETAGAAAGGAGAVKAEAGSAAAYGPGAK